MVRRFAVALMLLGAGPAWADVPDAERLDRPHGVVRSPSLSLSPRFSPVGGDALNDDVTAGLSITIHPASFVAFEANISLFPRSGAGNLTSLATAALELQDRATTGLESVDRLASFTAMALFVPASGYVAPPGLPGVHLELLTGIGAGVELAHLENLQLEAGIPVLIDDVDLHPRGVVAGLLGVRIAPIPAIAFRFDARLQGGQERVLDYSTEAHAALNQSLPEGATANRSLCRVESSDAECRAAPFGTATIELAIEFTLGASWASD